MEKKIAILYIGIGKYIDFWKGFYLTCEKWFLPNAKKEYFVFTDSDSFFGMNTMEVHKYYQDDLGWPRNSLDRYEFFMRIRGELMNYDYVFFFNGNVFFLEEITEEEFLPEDDELLVVGHHYFWNKDNCQFPYERDPHSTACIPEGEGKYYVCGGMNGGTAAKFDHFMTTLYERIKEDDKHGKVAIWHDESHVNRYILDYSKIKLLPPEYCYPELVANPEISVSRKIICRDKRIYFNLYQFKNSSEELDLLRNDSKHLLEEKKKRELLERWLQIDKNAVPHFLLERGITIIDLLISDDVYGEVVFSTIKQDGNISIGRLIQYNGKNYKREDETNQSNTLVVCDSFRYTRLFEQDIVRRYKNVFSIEDIINKEYENGSKLDIDTTGYVEYQENIDFSLGIDLLNPLARYVLYGAGKIGKKYYTGLTDKTFNICDWVDANPTDKREQGLPVNGLDKLDGEYDYLILGTSNKEIAVSMWKDLEKKNCADKRVLWFDRNMCKWNEGIIRE